MKRFLTKPRNIVILMCLLLVVAAGIFLVAGLLLQPVVDKELQKIIPAATASPSSRPATAFAGLVGQTLNPSLQQKYVADISQPHGLGVLAGQLYISSWGNRTVTVFDLVTDQRRQLTDELNGAHDMVLADDGQLVTPLFHDNRVVKIDRVSGRVTQLVGGLAGPNGIAKARDGGFYVTNAGDGTVVKVSAQGKLERTVARNLNQPAGILADNDNILLVAQYGDPVNSIIQIEDNGRISTVIRGLTNTESLLRDDQRNILIGHVADGRGVISLWPRGKDNVQPILATGLPGPIVGPVTDGRYLYYESAAPGQSSVYRIALP